MSTGREIRLIEEDDGWWSAIDEGVGVASQGPTRSEALQNLDDVIRLHRRDDDDVEDEGEALRDLGIDPHEIKSARAERQSLPDGMQ